MTDCCGLMGKIFGHCYKKYKIKSRYKPSGETSLRGQSVFEYFEMQRNIYEIRCKRCGKHAKDN